jgi:hypothetical protein
VKEKPQPTVVDMPLAAVHAMPEVQPRVAGLHAPTVAEYRERHRAGDEFPPLVAYGTRKRAILSEGFHRHEVYRLEGVETVRVELRPGDQEAATLNALASNARHGLPRTNKDKRAAVERLLSMRPEWSNRRVAAHCGVSDPFVSEIRQVLTVSTCEPQKREGKDGKTYTVPPKENAPKSTAAKDIGNDDRDGDEQAISQSDDADGEPESPPDEPTVVGDGPGDGGEPGPESDPESAAATEEPAAPTESHQADAGPAPLLKPAKPKAPPELDGYGIPVQPHAKEAWEAVPRLKRLVAMAREVQAEFAAVAELPGGVHLQGNGRSSYHVGRKKPDGTESAGRWVSAALDQFVKHVEDATPTYSVCPWQFVDKPHGADCPTCKDLNWTPPLIRGKVTEDIARRAKEAHGGI